MQKSSAPNNSFDSDAPGAPGAGTSEPVIGDADAVQKTTYVVGEGTDDRAGQRPAKRTDGDALTQPPRDVPDRRGTGPDDATTGG